ncbi:MAG: hypothetical protein ACKOAL_02685, partial [Chthoniobacterales bacterium]
MRINSLLFSGALLATTFTAAAHGPGHVHRSQEQATITEAVDVQETGIPVAATDSDRIWGVNATTGWE